MSGLRIIELVVAGLFFVGGIHSFWYWVRKPIDSDHPRDQVWYSLYRTGRIGLWFAVGGIFLLSGLSSTEGSAFSKEFAKHRWYLMVLLLLALMQLIGGYLLGRSADRRPSTTDAPRPPRNGH
jgi:hypothetical protein